MRTHAGQVAFPGGRIDAGEDADAAALREAWEELGLEPAAVEPVGIARPLSHHHRLRGHPGGRRRSRPTCRSSPHEREVADWFEAPLGFVLDPANQQRHSVLFEGRMRHYYRIDWNGRNIWGATAAMLVNLSRRLQWS